MRDSGTDEPAACVIRDTKVSVVPFHQVSPEHAYKEGEGDRSLGTYHTFVHGAVNGNLGVNRSPRHCEPVPQHWCDNLPGERTI